MDIHAASRSYEAWLSRHTSAVHDGPEYAQTYADGRESIRVPACDVLPVAAMLARGLSALTGRPPCAGGRRPPHREFRDVARSGRTIDLGGSTSGRSLRAAVHAGSGAPCRKRHARAKPARSPKTIQARNDIPTILHDSVRGVTGAFLAISDSRGRNCHGEIWEEGVGQSGRGNA